MVRQEAQLNWILSKSTVILDMEKELNSFALSEI